MFIDYLTEFFLIQFSGYNPNKRVWVTIKLIFEQAPNGLTYTTYKVCTLSIFQEINLIYDFKINFETITVLFANGIIVIYTLYSIYCITKSLIQNYKKYLSKFWNVFLIAKIFLYLLAILIRITFYFIVFNTIPIGYNVDSTFIDTDSICLLNSFLEFLDVINTCLSLIYFLSFLERRIIEPISLTIQDSIKNIFTYLVSFFFNIMGFAFFAYYTYGTRTLSN